MIDLPPINQIPTEVRERFKDVLLGSPKGRDVFETILGELGIFAQTTGPEATALRNYAIRLVQIVAPDDGAVLSSGFVNSINTARKMEIKQYNKELDNE